jgi:hypothetical protein
MARQRSRAADHTVYLLVRVVVCVVQALPWPWALSLARAWAGLPDRPAAPPVF